MLAKEQVSDWASMRLNFEFVLGLRLNFES